MQEKNGSVTGCRVCGWLMLSVDGFCTVGRSDSEVSRLMCPTSDVRTSCWCRRRLWIMFCALGEAG